MVNLSRARDNRVVNYLFGARGETFKSLQDIVDSGFIQGIEQDPADKDNVITATPSYFANRAGVELNSPYLIGKGPRGITYDKIANPKNYEALLQGFKRLYGYWGDKRERCTEVKYGDGKDVTVDYIFSSGKEPRAVFQLQINTENGEVNMIYQQLGKIKNEKTAVSDLNRIFEVLGYNSALFERTLAGKTPKKLGRIKVPKRP